MAYIITENYSNPIPQTILQKKNYEFPCGSWGSGSGGTNNFQFVNGVYFINEFSEFLSGNIIEQEIEYIQNFSIPQEFTNRKIMAFVKLNGNYQGDSIENLNVKYKIKINEKEYEITLQKFQFNDFRILIPVNCYENNQITATIFKDGNANSCFVNAVINSVITLI
ncbi:MAG: hypothetical protein QW474_01105 [Candidatus Aenigmatarchaeota archaeon]